MKNISSKSVSNINDNFKFTPGLISVIMPAYNSENFISESIESVISQTYIYWELIIIDDGSTDSTKDVVSPFLDRDSRIRYFYQKNGKQGKARNRGIENSRGEYLAFLDSDDLWLPQKLELQLKDITDRDVDLVFCDSLVFNDNTAFNHDNNFGVKTGFIYGDKAIKLFIQCNRIPILTVLAKKSKIIKVGGFPEKHELQNCEDYHLWLKLLLNGSTFYSSEIVLAKYRVHLQSVTANDISADLKLLAVYSDLKRDNLNYSLEFNERMMSIFRFFYMKKLFSKKELSTLIKLNTYCLSKSKFEFILLTINWFFPTKVTKRVLVFSLNKGYKC